MDLFDIVGPIMVGPSSSHTAGAVRIGYIAGQLLGEPLKEAQIQLYGSFLATGEGHGTKKAIVAGLLGMKPDDYHIADSFDIARKRDIGISFGEARLEEAHPNTAVLHLTGTSGKSMEVTSMLAHKGVNIATMQLYRSARGQNAVMVIECDQPIPQDGISWPEHVEGVLKVTYFSGN